MRRLPPLHTLRAFEAAARHESFLRAAEEIHLTPSAVSHQIRSLEENLGITLFHRHPRAVSLTEAGGEFLLTVREALDNLERTVRRLTSDSAERVLTVSAAPVFAMGWLIPRLADFHAAYPDIEVRLDTQLEFVDFAKSDVDLAIRYSASPQAPGLVTHLLFHEQPTVICSPALAEKLKTPDDLRRCTLIHTYTQVGKWRAVLAAAGMTDIDLDRGPHFANDMLALEAAASGLGAAIVNRNVAEIWVAEGRIVIPFELDYCGDHGYHLVYPANAADRPRVVAFRDWLQGIIEGETPADASAVEAG